MNNVTDSLWVFHNLYNAANKITYSNAHMCYYEIGRHFLDNNLEHIKRYFVDQAINVNCYVGFWFSKHKNINSDPCITIMFANNTDVFRVFQNYLEDSYSKFKTFEDSHYDEKYKIALNICTFLSVLFNEYHGNNIRPETFMAGNFSVDKIVEDIYERRCTNIMTYVPLCDYQKAWPEELDIIDDGVLNY